MQTQERTFQIRDLIIHGDVLLAPMDGYTDSPMRRICRQFGSAMSYTEFINTRDYLSGYVDQSLRYAFAEEERPVVFQLLDENPERLLRAAQKLQELNPDLIDINMGCPEYGIAKRGAGAGMLHDIPKIGRLFGMLSRNLNVPVSAKVRLGWDENDNKNGLLAARAVEENGGVLVAVHARTRQQGYHGQADWDAIAEICQAVKIPVIGNGDVRTADDIDKLEKHSGCAAVMIGRAAIGNPWIFAHSDRKEVSLTELRAVMGRHLEYMQEFYGPRLGLIYFRKHTTRYLIPLLVDKALRQHLLTREDAQDYLDTLDQIFLTSVIR